MAERFLYFPMVGFCLVAALALLAVGEEICAVLTLPVRWRARATFALPAILLAGFGFRTYARNADWATEFSLWKSTVTAAPNSFKARKGMANGYFNLGMKSRDPASREAGVDDAIKQAEIGLIVLDSAKLSVERQDNTLFCDLGMYYEQKGLSLQRRNETTEARRFFQKGVDVMLRAKEVDTYVNKASREMQLSHGRKPEVIADVGNTPRLISSSPRVTTISRIGRTRSSRPATASTCRP